MVKRSGRKALWLAGSAVVLLGLAGCQGSDEVDERVEAANNRWLAMRSAMMLQMGEQQFEAGDLTQAERTVRDAIQMDPERASLWVLAGRIELEHGRLERAYHLFDRAIEADVEHAEAHYYQALVLQRWRRFDQAYERYAQAYELQPDKQGYLLATVEMMVELDRVDQAIALLEERLNYFDQSSGLHAALGHMYMKQGNAAQAVERFEDAATLAPDNEQYRQEVALAHVAAGNNERGIQLLRELLQSDTFAQRRDLRRALAQAYEQQGKRDLAREQYLRLARESQGDASDWVRLAELAWEDDKLNDALYAAQRATREAPRDGSGFLMAGLISYERGDVDRAVDHLEQAAELLPDSNEALILLGVAYEQLDRGEDAVRAYQSALERQPEDERAHRLLQQTSH